ncbi:hypothetical protein M405DRAFT_936449 [Rhizopogon salebrosus TDB-379]|nr:hypothetical protein M405DRAFT_936449 [Rhizopogon salebrosus TDB-379]
MLIVFRRSCNLFSHCHHERFDGRSSNESQWRGSLFVCPSHAVERQARGGFLFHTFRASAVVDDAVSSHVCMREPRDISVVDRQLVKDARPFGILGVLAASFIDEETEIFYFEEEAMLVAVLVIVRGEHTV